MRALAVKIPHDVDPTVALRVDHGERSVAVITDMGRPDAAAVERLANTDVLVLEFNHDPELLAAGPYSDALKRRICGGAGHLSNAQAAELLAALAGPRLHTLVLAHLSLTNNRPELAVAAARGALEELGRPEVRVVVAAQDEPGPVLDV